MLCACGCKNLNCKHVIKERHKRICQSVKRAYTQSEEPHMNLPIPPFLQKTEYDCGPASLKMVLNYFGIKPKYNELNKLSKCDSNGTDSLAMVRALKRLGIEAHAYEFCSLADLRSWNARGLPVIVAWFSPAPGSHWSVVKSVGNKRITLQDPGIGRERRLNLDYFESVWFTIDPGVGSTWAYRKPTLYVGWREVVVPTGLIKKVEKK